MSEWLTDFSLADWPLRDTRYPRLAALCVALFCAVLWIESHLCLFIDCCLLLMNVDPLPTAAPQPGWLVDCCLFVLP